MEIPVNRGSFTSGLTSRLVVTGILCWALAGTAYAVLRLTFGERPVRVHVQWAPIIDDAARLQLEERYRLARAEPMGDRTFAYALTDLARDNISNLVLDPAVDDTHEIDRTAFRVWDTAPRLLYVTAIPGIPVVLELLSVLGFLGGLASISLALFKRAAPALARDWILSLATGGSQPLRFWLRIALVAAVLLLGVGLRAWRLGDQPAHNATADEYALTWAGMTLVANGTPQSWSWLDAYGTRSVIQWRGNPYPIVQPWMDHPPLYPLVMGLWMRVGGYIDPLSVDLRYMRVSSVLLFGLSFFLLAQLALRNLAFPAGVVALLLYAVAPPAVIQQRLVVTEALWVSLGLAAFLLMQRWQKTRSTRILLGLTCVCALLPLSKGAALAYSFALLVAAAREREKSLVAAVCTGTVLGLILWVIYGALVGGDMFFAVQGSHADRFNGFDGFVALLFHPSVLSSLVNYLPWLLGLIWSIALMGDARGPAWSVIPVAYAAAMTFFVDEEFVYGWYYLPMYPWLCLAMGDLFWRGWHTRRPGVTWLWFVFAWVGAVAWMLEAEVLSTEVLRYLYLLGLLGVTFYTLLPRRILWITARWVVGVGTAGWIVSGVAQVLWGALSS